MFFKEIVPVQDWEKERAKILDFWQSRKVQFTTAGSDQLQGRRGSMLGNFLSFNMQKLATKVAIKKIDQNRFEFTMEVSSLFQHITQTNAEYWNLEIRTFKEFLSNGDLLEGEWADYQKRSRKNNILWVLSIVAAVVLIRILAY